MVDMKMPGPRSHVPTGRIEFRSRASRVQALHASPWKGLAAACALIAAATQAPAFGGDFSDEFSTGGNVALTTDYIYRGVSESDGHPALQADLHANSDGSFAGVWASTRDRDLQPGAPGELEVYFGHRFDLSSAWSTTLSARGHYFLGATQTSADYQEVSAGLAWLDRWTFTMAVIPNAVRWYEYTRLSRSPAWVAETSGQWLIGRGLFVTGGAGYYHSSSAAPAGTTGRPASGYAYGNVGLAFEAHQWRLEVGYFLAQNRVQDLLPYPPVNRHLAGTVSWHF
jgi:uncharacterized protein (TIGR02001 family)